MISPAPVAFLNPRWPDVSAIAYSHSTNDESIEEVLEELRTLSLKSIGSPATEFSSQAHERSTEQFEKGGARTNLYCRVLRRVKRGALGSTHFK